MLGDMFSAVIGFSWMLLILLPIAIGYYLLWQEHAFMRAMAASLGFTYMKKGGPVDSKILSDEGGKIYDDISGVYKDAQVRAFTYALYIKTGKSGHWSYATVFELDSPTPMPELVLNPLSVGIFTNEASRWSLSSAQNSAMFLGTNEKIELEGDFGTYFSLYAQKDAQLEAREIFQPDMMAYFIDNFKDMGLECAKNKFYIFPMKLIRSEGEFLQALDQAMQISQKIKMSGGLTSGQIDQLQS